LWGWAGAAIPDELTADLRRWAESVNAYSDLAELLTGSEIDALRSRVDALLAAPRMPLPREDRPSIPWPPF
jgi:hypothetical protein